jgi:DNA-binding NarL/FixJ family response regulator
VKTSSINASCITCLVADDHPLVLDSLTRVLRVNGIDVVGEASNGLEALAGIEVATPQVAVVDLCMPDITGIEVARRAQRVAPTTAVIVCTGYDDVSLVTEAFDAGARGLLLKEAPLAEIVRAIKLVADNGRYLDARLGAMHTHPSSEIAALTHGERDVLRLLANGYSNEQIAQQLFIATDTVRARIHRAIQKLGARTRTEAVATALRQSLIG